MLDTLPPVVYKNSLPVSILRRNMPMSDSAAPVRSPPRRELKGAILWCSRNLLDPNQFYSGPIAVTIAYGTERDSITVKPSRGVDGLTTPDMIRVPSESGPTVAASVSELVRAMFGDGERAILRELARLEPAAAGEVCEAVKSSHVERSRFWVLWGELQSRGLVKEDDDGFRLGAEWVRAVVAPAGAEKTGKPAA